MLKLYYTPGTCSLAPHIALEETGERYELARVDLAANQQNSPDFMRLNPKARVPVLTDGDWALTEAPAILRYIAARHPAAGLWPWDPREEARCAEWLGWLSSTVHVGAGYVRRAARYASDPRAVEDVAATGRKTCRALWEAVGAKDRAGTVGDRRTLQRRRSLFAGLLVVGAQPASWLRHGARFSALDRACAPHGAPAGGAARVRQRRLAVAELNGCL